MKVLVLGSGGREHALVLKLSYSPQRPRLYVAPGNPGIGPLAQRVPIPPSDLDRIVGFAEHEKMDLVVCGPEAPLVAGIADRLRYAGIPCVGPDRLQALLEGSKSYARTVMSQFGIPQPRYGVFRTPPDAMEWIRREERPVVIKADGLCSGKGVFLPDTPGECARVLDRILVERCFGREGQAVVVEERLSGAEASFLCFCDGKVAVPMPSARDYKRVGDSDQGPNTGGMGAVSPNPAMTSRLEGEVMEKVVQPLLSGLEGASQAYRGILYVGLMLTAEGPKVLEFNVRFGDPEAQVILARLNSDLLDVLLASTEERLGDMRLAWDSRPAVCVVMASEGYPGQVKDGRLIEGLEESGSPDVMVTHGGTRREGARLLTAGGRVLSVTALARTIPLARAAAYEAVGRIRFEGEHHRTDIGRELK